MPTPMDNDDTSANIQPSSPAAEEKQCRICLDGADAEPQLGKLIRPCLCKGSISVSPERAISFSFPGS